MAKSYRWVGGWCGWPMGLLCHPKSFDWDLDFWTLDLGLTISLKVIPGCGCCLRHNSNSNPNEYLVADGTTWVVDGKVFGR